MSENSPRELASLLTEDLQAVHQKVSLFSQWQPTLAGCAFKERGRNDN